MFRSLPTLAALAGVLAVSACGVFGGPSAPEPPYEVVRADEPFEVRAYPALAVASTPMESGTGGAFGRLFDYISGENRGAQEIEMTAPVIQQPAEGTKISMTAPVLQRPGPDGQPRMVFILPAGMNAETAPFPTDASVRLDRLPPRRVAVIRFSGLVRDAKIDEARERLSAWIDSEGLVAAGPAELAGYNPPWTLPWFRRNEILIPVADR
jgi:hypothetical protein